MDDAGLKKFLEDNSQLREWPRTNWDVDSLTLAAFYFHPSLAVARAQWLVADAGIKTAGARPNPTVNFGPGFDSSVTVDPWLPFVNFDIPIETAGKRGKRLAEAKEVAVSARFSFISAAWKVRSDVRAALLDFKLSEQRAELTQKQFAAQKQLVQLLQKRFEAGEVSRPDLATAQIALGKAQMDDSDAQLKVANARSVLAQALGVPVAALDGMKLEFSFSQAALSDLTSAEARRLAVLSRADVLSALADYAAAEDDLRLEIAKQYPDVHLSPGYQLDNGDNKWSLGIGIELPVLDQNQGPIAEAKARRELAAAKFIELQSQVIADIDRAVAGYHAAEAQKQNAEDLFESEQQQQKFAEAQLKAGAADSMDAANAELEFDSAALARLDSEEKFQSAIGALEDALQRPADSIAATIEKISRSPDKTDSRK